jgi:hypothetical protein
MTTAAKTESTGPSGLDWRRSAIGWGSAGRRVASGASRGIGRFLGRFFPDWVVASRMGHRSFMEARLTNAKSTEIIQNLTMIFGSAQPFFSK